MATKQVKEDNLNRAQAAKKRYEEAAAQRESDAKALKASYLAGKGDIIVDDLKKKIANWMALNNKVAQDGVGARATGHKLTDGSEEIENVYLTSEQRASYLDQSKGMQAIYDYIVRQTTIPAPAAKPSKNKTKK